ncbi:MAG: pilus assembly protein PilB, partial [Nitrospira sp.]
MLRSLTRTSLAEILVDQGMLTACTVEDVLRRCNGVPVALGQMLISEGLLSEDQLAQALAVRYSLPYDPLKEFQVDSRYYETISVKLMQRFPFIPIAERDGVLTIAIADPNNVLGLDELELLIGKPLELIVSTK